MTAVTRMSRTRLLMWASNEPSRFPRTASALTIITKRPTGKEYFFTTRLKQRHDLNYAAHADIPWVYSHSPIDPHNGLSREPGLTCSPTDSNDRLCKQDYDDVCSRWTLSRVLLASPEVYGLSPCNRVMDPNTTTMVVTTTTHSHQASTDKGVKGMMEAGPFADRGPA